MKTENTAMAAFQLQTIVPADGNLSIVVPEYLRGKRIELNVSAEIADETGETAEEREKRITDTFFSLCGTLDIQDYSDIRDEGDRDL